MGKWVTSPESLSLITWAPNHFSLYSGAVRTSPSVGVLRRSELSRLVSSLATGQSVPIASCWCLPACTLSEIQCVCVVPLGLLLPTLFKFLVGLPLAHLLTLHVLCSLSVMLISLR